MQNYQVSPILLKNSRKRCMSAQDTQATYALTPKSNSTKNKQKVALLNFFNQDTEIRKLEEKAFSVDRKHTIEAQLKKQSESKKFLNNRKLLLQQQRYSIIQKEHEECMNILNEKHKRSVHTPSGSRSTSFIKWRKKSKDKLEQLKLEEDQKIVIKLQRYEQKEKRSGIQKQNELQRVSKSARRLNSKVYQVHEKVIKTVENSDSRYMELISKNRSISCRKLKLENDLQIKLEKKKRMRVEKKLRLDMNMNDLKNEKEKREKALEDKHLRSVRNLERRRSQLGAVIESKQDKERVRAEKSVDKLMSQRRKEFEAKQEIIKKHIITDHKLKIKKKTQEYFNLQNRNKVMKESQDRSKSKQIRLTISKSKEPIDISSVLSSF